MNISELIEALEANLDLHGDLEVRVTWEGIAEPIAADNVYSGYCEAFNRDTRLDETFRVLYIDGDECTYKDLMMSKPDDS